MNHQLGHLLEGGHDERFVGFGYESIYLLANLSFIVFLAGVVLLMWALLWIKNFFSARCSRRMRLRERIWYDDFEGRWHNLAHRFTYEVFLELLICVLISLAVRNPYTGDNFSTAEMEQARFEGVGGIIDTYDHLLATVVIIVAGCFFIWAVSFAWRQIFTALGCNKTRYKPLTNGIWCCGKGEFFLTLKQCPQKCIGALLECLLCRRKKRSRRRRKSAAQKYSIKSDSTRYGLSLSNGTVALDESSSRVFGEQGDVSKTMLLGRIDEEGSSGSDSSDDFVARKAKLAARKKRIEAGKRATSSSEEEDNLMSGADLML